jgi:exodeoxyribonuclease V alpha subunit
VCHFGDLADLAANVPTVSQFDQEVVVRRTRYASEETGWAVVDVDDADGEPVVLVGPLVHLEDRERARVIGTWVDDSRYGLQVKVSEARPLPPSDAETLAVYLCRVKHVGAKRAHQLIERYGTEHALDAIDRDPEEAFAAVGLRRARAHAAALSWHELRVTRRLHMLLAPHGLGYLVKRIHAEYGPTAHRVVSLRPYELTSVFGVGFLVADKIASAVGSPVDADARARAGALHALAEAERSGSTCMPADELAATLAELLRSAVPDGLLERLVVDGDLVQAGDMLYRPETAALEVELAERVRAALDSRSGGRLRVPEEDALGAQDDGPQLTPEQLMGVRNAFAQRLSLITGGPGTGKTASIKTIVAVATAQRARITLVAPTGRAAIRMSEASGINASTVHSALGWVPGEGPTYDEEDLPTDLLIVDESSMANLELMVTLLRAVGPRTHLVLVGDADQLAPVGAGKPFAELVSSGLVPTVRLTHIFRQAAGSMIVQGAHAIRRGQAPSFAATEGMRRDLFMIERADPLAAREEIVSLVANRLPAHYQIDPVTDVQVFAPVYRGELGIDALNLALREALNPDGQAVGGGRLRIGDKLMMTGRNLHKLGLMNGTLLRLIDEVAGSAEDDDDRDDESALILAAEDAIFRLPPEESDSLRLAYACSVHRGQGIELPVAIIVAHPAAGAFFLRREMLYTAVTRAKLATVIVGSRAAIANAALTPDTGRRHSRLAERLAVT